MKKVLAILLAVAALLVVVMAWQHLRYANAQSQLVQDQQDAFYGAETFHVITFFKVADETTVIARAAELVTALESNEVGKLIYAGQSAFTNGTTSLAETSWSGVAMMQYDSRGDYQLANSSPEYQTVLGSFALTYSIGMDRPVTFNLLLRQGLLFMDIRNRLLGPSIEPLTPISDIDTGERVLPLRAIEKQLRAPRRR